MKRAQKGDDKAFLKLFQHYEADIYRMAFVYVKNENDALDIVQEVAYRSFQQIDTLKNPAYFKTWLMRIAINCAINSLRSKKKVVQLKPEFVKLTGVMDEDISLSVTLKELIERLDEEEKSLVLLRFYQDLTFREISKTLDIPLGTAKSVLYRALRKLRKDYLKGEDANE